MELLKNPIEITKTIADALTYMKGTLVFNKRLAWLIIIQDYKIDEIHISKKRWRFLSRNETKYTTYYLSEFKFHVWSTKRQAWTHMTEDVLNEILYDPDFPNMRKNYFNMIKAPLEFLGANFNKNKVINDRTTK